MDAQPTIYETTSSIEKDYKHDVNTVHANGIITCSFNFKEHPDDIIIKCNSLFSTMSQMTCKIDGKILIMAGVDKNTILDGEETISPSDNTTMKAGIIYRIDFETSVEWCICLTRGQVFLSPRSFIDNEIKHDKTSKTNIVVISVIIVFIALAVFVFI